MRTEVKAGFVVGLVIIAGGLIWFASRGGPGEGEATDIPFTLTPEQAAQRPEPAAGQGAQPSPAARSPSGTPSPRTARPAQPTRERETTTPPLTREPARPAERVATAPPRTVPTVPPDLAARPSEDARTTESPAGPTTRPAEPQVGRTGALDRRDLPPLVQRPPEESALPVAVPPRRTEPQEAAPDVPAGRGDLASRLRDLQTPPPASKIYTVQPADTLSAIAREQYGDDRYWRAIVAANPELKNPDVLTPGQVLKLPPKEQVVSRGSTTPPAGPATPGGTTAGAPGEPRPSGATPPAAGRATYVVERSDTLISIARNVLGDGSRWREIYELNRERIANPNHITVGLELRMPPVRPATATRRP